MGKWEEFKFEEVVNNFDGKRVPIKASERKKSKGGKYPYYGASGIIDYVDDFIFEGEHLLISEDGANLLARVYPIAFKADGKFWVNNHAHIVKARKEKTTNDFLEYYFSSIDISEYVTGSAQPKLNQKKLNSVKIPLPPLTEQKRIVEKLDRIFTKIDQAISLLEENIEHTQALMGSVLDEELSRFETKTSKIKDVLSEINSGFACNKSNELPDGHVHLRTHNIDTEGNLNFDLMVRINPEKVDQKKSKIRKGDILFNNTNSKELVGKTALVDKDYDYGYSNHLTKIRLKEDLILPEFFVNYLVNLQSQGYFLQICKKWIGQAGVNTGMLKDIEIKFPSIKNQITLNKKIKKTKDKCSELIYQKTQKINHLKALKSSLLDQAFKGEL